MFSDICTLCFYKFILKLHIVLWLTYFFTFWQHVNPKKQTIGNSCKACGYRGMLDTHHKLCTFILKNPPENSDSGIGKKEKRKRKTEKENGSICSSETQ